MKNLTLLCAVTMLAACAVPQGGMKRSGGVGLFGNLGQPAQETQPFVEETVEVITSPPGARVHVNDGFVGYAPVKAAVRRIWSGTPGNMVLDLVKIEAFPVAGGQCVQSGLFGQNNLQVQSPVRFPMTNCAATRPAGKK
ncbi:MAG: hypothetical protein A2X35_05605 [Elusimicrobia bacterium GWA2_61_42]|nr:MAG: hypothetical protein A2X35_05605 [Elusimicrobia bacterium GWA2_61_42]OGR74159.1 MAG: hypothetical protein A2X38_11060 [Elusimicrobia bacterium GWC2_61_25]